VEGNESHSKRRAESDLPEYSFGTEKSIGMDKIIASQEIPAGNLSENLFT